MIYESANSGTAGTRVTPLTMAPKDRSPVLGAYDSSSNVVAKANR